MQHSDLSHDAPHLKRAMSTRHVVMISLGGAIGTGLFLGSGGVIASTGAIGAIVAYIVGAMVAYTVMLCLGELAVQMPEAGAFGAYATRYINPSTGYTVTWLYWLTWSVTLGTEFTAAALLMQEWFPHIQVWIWTIIFACSVFAINVFSTRLFAESEFWLCLIKVATVVAFILLGLCAIFGFVSYEGYQSAPLFHNLTADGWFPNGLIPIFTTMLAVNFAFSGVELIGVAAGETKDPAKNVPKAINAALFRLLVFFIGTIIVISALLPYSQVGLTGEGSKSPFVMVFTNIGIPYAEDIMRFVIITAILSAASSGLYAASRMMWSLADRKQLPPVFAKLTKRGTPVVAICATMVGGLPGLLSEQFEAELIFKSLMNVAAFTMVLVWMSICVSQYNFRRQWYAQGKSKADLGFASPLYPILPIVGFVSCVITGLSMLADKDNWSGFICCMLFIVGCYLSYHLQFKDKENHQ